MSHRLPPWRVSVEGGSTNGIAVVFDQQSDIVWMNQYYNCGDGVVPVGATKGDTKYVVGAC